jgi:hypothetical protein
MSIEVDVTAVVQTKSRVVGSSEEKSAADISSQSRIPLRCMRATD